MTPLVTDDQLVAALNIEAVDEADTLAELQLYVDAVTAYVANEYGELSASYVEELAVLEARLWLEHWPIISVEQATSVVAPSVVYTADFTIAADGRSVTHDSITSRLLAPDVIRTGPWEIQYTAGYTTAPADLQLAALLDVKSIYEASQLGAPGSLGQFDIASNDVDPASRPITWPRVDRWMAAHPSLLIG